MVKRVSWDSTFFGYEVGSYTIDGLSVLDLERLRDASKQFKLTYVKSPKLLPEVSDLNLVDIKVTWQLDVTEGIRSNRLLKKFIVEEYKDSIHSYEQLLDLAFLSGKYSRFRIDPNFKNQEFSRLYREWIAKSLDHTIAEKVLVCTLDKQLCGFITFRRIDESRAVVGLVAVNPEYQGQGIGSALIEAVKDFCRDNAIHSIEVSTQKANSPAMKLYQKNGFSIKSFDHIYHLWNT